MKSVLFFALAMLCGGAYGQTYTIHNLTSLRRDTPLLFANVPNRLAIVPHNIPAADFRIRVVGRSGDILGTMKTMQGDTLILSFRPEPGDVRVIISRGSKAIGSAAYRAVKVGSSIRARLGTLRDSIVSRAQLLAQRELRVVDDGSYFDVASYSRIHHYVFEANTGGEFQRIPVSGNGLSREVVEAIQSLRRGSRVVFTEIVAYCADCIGRRLPDVAFVIY